ncbi:hypothetical protein [Streptomyces sp. NBC_01565]|uniref:hypothetical protein n=1 Tax=unclassified Streptomyces TaxID=2593676 RepID=UPI002252C543|nr:hypothetical protein [Streptomyces sp. NBC_01565]MCX4545585.1 hypothetical protein [Streptomyces sp. NBC_01565]
MGKVLTTASTVTCGHVPPLPPVPPVPPPPVPGLIKTSSREKLKVGGKPVLVRSGIERAVIDKCPNVSPGPACTTVMAVSSGESLKLKSGGAPVVLDKIGLATNGSVQPPPVLTPEAGQSKLSSV